MHMMQHMAASRSEEYSGLEAAGARDPGCHGKGAKNDGRCHYHFSPSDLQYRARRLVVPTATC